VRVAGDECMVDISDHDLRKGTIKFDWFRTRWPDSFGIGTTGSMAELRSYSFELEMASTNGKRYRPELGFWPDWARERGRREGWCSRVLRWRCRGSYRPQGRRRSSGPSRKTMVDRTSGSVPPSCFLARGRQRRTGTRLVLWWDGKWANSVG
jgi:hypothetical protein